GGARLLGRFLAQDRPLAGRERWRHRVRCWGVGSPGDPQLDNAIHQLLGTNGPRKYCLFTFANQRSKGIGDRREQNRSLLHNFGAMESGAITVPRSHHKLPFFLGLEVWLEQNCPFSRPMRWSLSKFPSEPKMKAVVIHHSEFKCC